MNTKLRKIVQSFLYLLLLFMHEPHRSRMDHLLSRRISVIRSHRLASECAAAIGTTAHGARVKSLRAHKIITNEWCKQKTQSHSLQLNHLRTHEHWALGIEQSMERGYEAMQLKRFCRLVKVISFYGFSH